jgi:hypothetical protein
MKKIYSAFYALLIISALFIASCEKDDYTGYSTLTASDAKATLEWTAPASVVEGELVYPFTITLDKKQVADIHIPITVSGTATSGADYSVSDEIIISAFTTSASGELKIMGDADIEETETVTVQIGDDKVANVDFAAQTKTVEILNRVYPNLDLTFDWSGEVTYDGATVELCDEVDMDIYVFDVDNNDLGIYNAATGACPEHLTFESQADGDYYLWANLYASSVAPTDGSVISFPITTYATQPGNFEDVMYSQAAASVIVSTDPAEDTFKPVMKVTKAGTNYTITPL